MMVLCRMLTSSAELSSGDTTPATVLVVERDILARMVLADYLRDCGYKVVEGVNSDDVLAVLEAGKKIDVVLAEVELGGGINGFELARLIRRNHPDIDVILTSGATGAAERAGDLCEEGPLEKPYHPEEVVRRINALRERRRKSRRP
jgi:DNA-binding response OmpR family regulator